MTDDTPATDRTNESDGQLPLSRRAALALLGAGGAAAAATGPAAATHTNGDGGAPTRPWNQHVDAQDHDLTNVASLEADHASLGTLDVDVTYTSAREADVIVWKDDDGTWYADGTTERVATGSDVLAVTQAAVDSLTDGRDWQEKVLVVSPGTATGEVSAISVPSYTVLDMPYRVHIPTDVDVDYVVNATDETDIAIPRLHVTGAPFIPCRLQGVRRTTVGEFRYYADPDADTDVGLRIDDWGGEVQCEDVQVGRAYVEHSENHGVETVNVHRFQADQIIGNDTGGTACLLNRTTDATVNSVVGYETGSKEEAYATFRLANDNQNISVGQVVSRGGFRGLAIITDAQRVSIGEVDIAEPELSGIQMVDAADVTIGGGVIRNPGDHGVNIYSLNNEPPNENISITDLRIIDDRDETEMEYAINEGGESANNRFVDNDLDPGTQGVINVGSGTTVVRDNTGGSLDEGKMTLTGGAAPAARVEGVTATGSSALEARIQPVRPPETAFGFESHFEWTGGEWDLVVEWTTDPGTDVDATYIVDRDQPNLAGVETGPPSEWNPDEVDEEPGAGVIDDFEDENISEYVGATGAYEVNSDAPVAEGSYSLKNTGGDEALIGSFAGLDRYPSAGDTFAAKAASIDDAENFGLLFGMQDLSNFYFTRYWKGGPDLQIWRVEDGSYSELASVDVPETTVGTVYDYVVDWAADGTITLELRETDGTVIGTTTAQDTTFTEGGIGTRRSGMLDDIRITDAGSQ